MANESPKPTSSPRPQQQIPPNAGYTGNCCDTCGGVRMVRSGTCERCEDCGSTSGCS